MVDAAVIAERSGVSAEVASAVIEAHRFVIEFASAAGCVVAHFAGFVFGPYDSGERRFVRDNFVELLRSWPEDVDFSAYVEGCYPSHVTPRNPGQVVVSGELDDVVVGVAARRWPTLNRDELADAVDALGRAVSERAVWGCRWSPMFKRNERVFEEWLVDHLHQLERVGWGLELVARQPRVLNGAGRLDLLCRVTTTGPAGAWPGDFVVVENKATECQVADLDQVDRYRQAVSKRTDAAGHQVFGIVIADGPGDRATAEAAARSGIRLVTWAETGFWDSRWFSNGATPLADAWCGTGSLSGTSRSGRPLSPLYRVAHPFETRVLSSGTDDDVVRSYRFVPPDDGERAVEVGCRSDGGVVTVSGDLGSHGEFQSALGVYGSPLSVGLLQRWWKPINGWQIIEV